MTKCPVRGTATALWAMAFECAMHPSTRSRLHPPKYPWRRRHAQDLAAPTAGYDSRDGHLRYLLGKEGSCDAARAPTRNVSAEESSRTEFSGGAADIGLPAYISCNDLYCQNMLQLLSLQELRCKPATLNDGSTGPATGHRAEVVCAETAFAT